MNYINWTDEKTSVTQPLMSHHGDISDPPVYDYSMYTAEYRPTFAQRAFTVAGPLVWNSLPDYLRDPAAGRDTFCKHLKTFLFAVYWYMQRVRAFTTSMHYINLRLLTYYRRRKIDLLDRSTAISRVSMHSCVLYTVVVKNVQHTFDDN